MTESNEDTSVAVAEPQVLVKDKTDKKPKRQPPYNVILMNDEFHTVQYVVALCKKIFGHPVEKGLMVAKEVDQSGRAILWTGTRELAELKQEQIHSLGADPLVEKCVGSMTAVIEPAA